MRDVTILADDLTGALDTASVFAAPGEPVAVGWTAFDGARSAIDSATRDVEPAVAADAVAALLPGLVDSRLPFKKIDSLLRGNSFVELAACVRSGLFQTVVVAPAFPDQGRTTVGGAVRVGGVASVDVMDGLSRQGIDATLLPRRTSPTGPGVFVCDADSADDLRAMVAGAGRSKTLWCGSSGLARALAPEPHRLTPRTQLIIIGSRHEVSRSHARQLQAALGPAAVNVAGARDVGAVSRAMTSGRRTALVLALAAMSAAEAEHAYIEIFAALAAQAPRPGGMIVVGGDTLLRLARALGVTAFEALGEFAPGLPVSRLRGGAWDGCNVISKSGAFADAGLLDDFVDGEIQSA